MAFTPGASEGVFNNTTEVALVSAPGSSTQRMVRSITIHNKDTAAIVVTISKKKASTLYRIAKIELEADTVLIDDTVRILDATDESIVAVLSGSVTANQPEYNTTYADQS